MSYKAFEEWNPSPSSIELIEAVLDILADYAAQGYRLTLRQLYYQLVSRDLIPNSDREYKRVGGLVSRGRLAGLIDWEMIEDRGRVPFENTHWESPAQILRAAARGYYLPRWEDQAFYIEVWCEKDAVSNIIRPVCQRQDVLFMANKGYSSQSAMYNASERMMDAINRGKSIEVIYIGDHDPSGIDMTRDIRDRLNLFLGDFAGCLSVHRIALNMDQVEQYQPPENPAKLTDSRASGYIRKYGYSSWELDALEPAVLSNLVDSYIERFVDIDKRAEVEELERDGEKKLIAVADTWEAQEAAE